MVSTIQLWKGVQLKYKMFVRISGGAFRNIGHESVSIRGAQRITV